MTAPLRVTHQKVKRMAAFLTGKIIPVNDQGWKETPVISSDTCQSCAAASGSTA
jgi:hypothetical protein